MLIVSWFICGVLYFWLYSYIFERLNYERSFYYKKDIIKCSLLFSLFYLLIMKYETGTIKPLLMHIVMIVCLMLLYKKSFGLTLISLFCIIILNIISELFFDLIVKYVLNLDISNVYNHGLIYIFSNVVIFLMCLLLFHLKYVKKLFLYFVKWYNKDQIKSLAVFIIMVVIIGAFILYSNFVNFISPSFLLLTNLFCICALVFVIGFFKVKAQNNRISSEYENLLKYVKVYENAVEEKNKNQHEYKNQLILLKGMLGKTNKKALNYINELLNTDSENEDINWLNKLKYVPQGGLKGLLYYKIQEMLKEDVKIFVDVSPELEKSTNSKIINKLLGDVSKVIGVYIDNSIEAVRELKEKYIVIEFYIESKNIVFSISNNYNGSIDMDSVDKEGYTTKGTGHGYGLSLVKDIIVKNDKLSQKRELSGIYFVQKLYIKK